MKKKIQIAIVGLGQIGNYLYNELITKKKDIEIKTGKKIQIVAISAKNKNKKRKFKINKKIFYKNPLDIIKDQKANVLIEAIGFADGLSKKVVENALKNKIHVITPNKALISKHGDYLSLLAEKNKVNLEFEAAVAGGIPIVRTIKEGLATNKITKVYGILNGITSVANLTGKVDQDGNVDGIGRAVLADSTATTIGALVGTSNTTSYIESGAGVKEGGRTGLTAVAVAVLFAICLFLAPLAQSIPAFATAPALVFVATFFLKNLRDIEWDDVSEYAPAVLAAVLMPLTFSIAHGIALGFIAYVVIKALSGRNEDLNAGSIVIGVLSVLYFIF